MIILDELFLGQGVEEALSSWYPGTVTNIIRLRLGTTIDDEEIPALLHTVREPTFVTINVTDFWRRVAADRRFGVVCFALPAEKLNEVPSLLRRLFKLPPFQTRKGRLGKIARVNTRQVLYYTTESKSIRLIPWPNRQGKRARKRRRSITTR